MKATILLTIALFLGLAPAPDAATIAEFSAQFIVLEPYQPLRAAESSGETHRSEPAQVAAPSHDANSLSQAGDTDRD